MLADEKGSWKREGGSYLYIHLHYRFVVLTEYETRQVSVRELINHSGNLLPSLIFDKIKREQYISERTLDE